MIKSLPAFSDSLEKTKKFEIILNLTLTTRLELDDRSDIGGVSCGVETRARGWNLASTRERRLLQVRRVSCAVHIGCGATLRI